MPSFEQRVTELGIVGPTIKNTLNYKGVYLQMSHKHNHQPPCNEPAFRLCRFYNSPREGKVLKKVLEKKLQNQGHIFCHKKDGASLILENLNDMNEHAANEFIKIKTQFVKDVDRVNMEYKLSHKLRSKLGPENGREKAISLQDEYIKDYNQRGWVKYMRKELNINPDIQIIPNMHYEAETQTEVLHQKKMESASSNNNTSDNGNKIDQVEENDDNDDDDVDESEIDNFLSTSNVPDYPSDLKTPKQNFAAISYIVSDDDNLNTLVFIHGVYEDEQTARADVEGILTDKLMPLPVNVVAMYEWIYPVRMNWNNNKLSKGASHLQESWANTHGDITKDQMDKYNATMKNRDIKAEAQKRKEMDEEVKIQLCDRLSITPEELDSIFDDKKIGGTNAVLKLATIEDEKERLNKVNSLLKMIAV